MVDLEFGMIMNVLRRGTKRAEKCDRCGVIVDFAHWNGEDHFLCDECVKYSQDEQIQMETIRRLRGGI